MLLLHLALLALFSQQGQTWWHKAAPTTDAVAPTALIWLAVPPLPLASPDPVSEPPPETVREPRAQRQPSAAPTQAPMQFVPAPPAAAVGSAHPSAIAPPEAAASAQAAPLVPSAPPLRLTLPRNALPQPLNPALADLRDPAARRTLESSLQAALGQAEGAITEERLSDGSVIFRRGNECVIARPVRAGTLDTFNQSVSPLPRLIDRC